jgi:hypothetical protein
MPWMHARAPRRCNIQILQIHKAQITEKINNNGNINVHQQDVVLPDCVHHGAPRSMVFFSKANPGRTYHGKIPTIKS